MNRLAPLLLLALPLSAFADDWAARVVAVEGDASVMRGKAGSFDLAVNDGLTASDLVTTDLGGSVILVLANDRVVRIDEDLSVRVNELVLFNAPKSTRSPADQLASVLYSTDDLASMGIADQRIAGFADGMSAISTPSHTQTDARGRREEAAPMARSAPATTGSSSAAPPPPTPAPGADTDAPAEASPSLSDQSSFAPTKAPLASVAPVRHIKAKKLQTELQSGELGLCLQAWADEAEIPAGTLNIKLHLGPDGAVQRIAVVGMATPECLRLGLLGAVIDGSAESDLTVAVTVAQ